MRLLRPIRHRRHRIARPALAACGAAVAAAVGLAGCVAQTETRDEGRAPRLTPPTSASPLWPEYTPPAAPTAPPLRPNMPVKGVSVPAGGLRKMSATELLLHDPNMPELVHQAIKPCPGKLCPLRKPVYRDLTGDGREELVVAADGPTVQLDLLVVYRASGRTIRPVLIYFSFGREGLNGETYGRDLVIRATGAEGMVTTRYRWNGEVMAPVTPQDATWEPGRTPAASLSGAPPTDTNPTADRGSGEGSGPGTSPVPGTDTRTDTRTTP
ncbi:hypothetical protein LRS74_27475 [Streptomyces sp. LX-29]|uniref:hypothetical protein n=1 Tax=Streptomyces sp. LX-29 TaxID=2900152 RepID=UPI00240D8EE9|nr:hypothetical protein [Streptomyces sp. LX-29]WFB10361.1 hypothetical protein LRS74_27475 [Streptomyces sp. LX-29]